MKRQYSPSDFNPKEKLYREFNQSDLLPATNTLEVNAISFPDLSCNWSRFSLPKDIRKRENANPSGGCYSFTVQVSQFENMATPCHDQMKSNFSHTEVRQLKIEEQIDFEPPKKRKLKGHNWNSQKLRYKQNIINKKTTEIEIEEKTDNGIINNFLSRAPILTNLFLSFISKKLYLPPKQKIN